ncbi:5'-methylthioadenosine/S-adenosylhomocysteine nucleosidase [Ferrovibrio xuzhouensis]|uniref:5'-methylthioadenosine/S-adenosylhomocysteine nucleosidase n=1 Tax=Ferrovibrio xuzhouensis TaxID=1576914 RepID=A0ABV7VF34_9PROT
MIRLLAILLLLALPAAATAADRLDPAPRIAVMSAFAPEWQVLKAATSDRKSHSVNGIDFVTGRLAGRNVVLFLSGISMVNATMSTQVALDRFDVTGIVFSGIAGGVDPALHVGDVVAASHWSQYLEATFGRDLGNGHYELPPWRQTTMPNYGMIFPAPVEVRRAGAAPDHKLWFDTDPGMLAAAGKIGDVGLRDCVKPGQCLDHKPRLLVGGNGVSGQAFVDNAAFREYVFATFKAQVLDMESAAVAMVSYANGVPFIAFRSLSDLAGGGPDANEMGTFMGLASENSARVVERFLQAWTPPR